MRKGYPMEMDTPSLIHDFIWGVVVANTGLAYECGNCGRLLIYRKTDASAKSFVPEAPSKGIFNRIPSNV